MPTARDFWQEAVDRRLGKLEDAKPDVQAERLDQLGKRFDALTDEVRTLRRALYTVALTVTGSALIFALTIFTRF